jgi:hypothetical protein
VAVFDDQVLALDPAERAHGCPELLKLGGRYAETVQDAYAADVCGGLRARTERPAENESAAEHGESATTIHGLTLPSKGTQRYYGIRGDFTLRPPTAAVGLYR